MSKQTSLVTFEGRMGNVSFFKSKGANRARMRGTGISMDRILKDPKLSRMRENLSEFAAVALTGKSFRRAVVKAKNFRDSQFGSRIAKVFTIMKKRSESTRGQRPVLISEHRSLLVGLEFNPAQNLLSSFSAPFTADHNVERTSATIAVENLNAKELITGPPAATHFRLVNLIGTVCDSVYDEDVKNFVPANAVMNGACEVAFSEYIPLVSSTPVSLTVEASLPAAIIPDETTTVIQCVGIVFYERIGTEYYSQEQGKAMKLIQAF